MCTRVRACAWAAARILVVAVVDQRGDEMVQS